MYGVGKGVWVCGYVRMWWIDDMNAGVWVDRNRD